MTVAEEKNPWLRLARLSEDHEENKQLWNGYQKYLLRPNEEDYQRQMENPKFEEIEELSDTTIHAIQAKIQDRPTELDPFDEINMAADIQEIKMPLNLEGFYFAFPVWLTGLRFTASLNLNYAQFSHGALFTGCVFEKHLWATESNFEQNTNFVDCKFNEGSSFRSATFEMADFRSATLKVTTTLKRQGLRLLFVLKMPVSPVQSVLMRRNFMLLSISIWQQLPSQ